MENYSVYFLNKYMYKLMADWEIPVKGPLTFIIFVMTVITNALLISVFVFDCLRFDLAKCLGRSDKMGF